MVGAIVGVTVGVIVIDSVGLGLSEGSGSASPLRAAHSAPAPSPITMATTTAMMIGFLDGPGSGSAWVHPPEAWPWSGSRVLRNHSQFQAAASAPREHPVVVPVVSASAPLTQSMLEVRAATSSGPTAGNMATRNWLRPNFAIRLDVQDPVGPQDLATAAASTSSAKSTVPTTADRNDGSVTYGWV